ncbi:MAG: biotin-dependent carboxyltransferase family protein [Psychromonas sp.]
MSLTIEKAGALSLLQDLGRYGFQDIGVTAGGPMDNHAFSWANKLLDNPENATQIEITVGAFKARFNDATSFSLCGAESVITLNGERIANWSSHHANSGDLLEIGYATKGLRSYLSVAGGFSIGKTLNSSSTVIRDKLGGLNQDGQKLQDKDCIPYAGKVIPFSRRVPACFIGDYKNIVEIGVLPTYQFHEFSPEARNLFFSGEYTITPYSNRMGYRLAGPAICSEWPGFISEGIALGAIQIPNNGQPIILMKDRQTIGGYPKIGCVCHKDLSLLAQSPSGTKIRFVLKELYAAEAQLHIEMNYFANS